jgi:hypothetical protein
MILDVYKITINTTTPRLHHALFVEAEGTEYGYLIHVLGDVQSGYTYDVYGGENDTGIKVEQVHGFLGKELIGYTEEGRLTEFMEACESVAPPGVQMNAQGVKIEKGKPWYRDGEWLEDAIRKLVSEGLLTML